MILNQSDQVNFEEDEIKISELIDAIKNGWREIFFCGFFGAAAFSIFSFSLPEKYEVQFYLDRPFSNQLLQLNVERNPLTGLNPVSPEDVYKYFAKEILTDAAKIRFFNQVYLPSLAEQPLDDLAKLRMQKEVLKKQVQIIEPKPKDRQQIQLRIEAPSSDLAVAWANNFLKLTQAEAKKHWTEDERSSIHITIQHAEKELTERRALAKQTRDDRKIQLKEALQIAQAVGQQGPQLMQGQLPRQDSVASFADGSNLYARGAKSLQAELAVLNERQDDAPFMDGLRETEVKIKLLKQQDPEKKDFDMYRIDGEIFPPTSPFFPKKSMFLLFGTMFGTVLGLLWAFKKGQIFKKLI